jgi:hypothetical protein
MCVWRCEEEKKCDAEQSMDVGGKVRERLLEIQL